MLGSSFLFGKEPEGCRQIAIGAHGSANRADCLPRGKPFGAPAGAGLLPMETDAPTPARKQGLQPYGALTLFFRWRKKSVQKKASGTATTGKRLLLPILTAGLAMSRAMELASLPIRAERARARLFPPSKWAGLFPSAAYRRPAPAQLAGDILNPCRVGCFGVACVFFARQKASGKSNPRWPFLRAMRPVAEWRSGLGQLSGSRTRPASREARRRAAVKPRPSRMSLYAPARPARSPGSRGHCQRLREP